MTPEEIQHTHCLRLRELQCRYDCADNVGNEAGCQMIQGLIDQENERFSQTSMSLAPTIKNK